MRYGEFGFPAPFNGSNRAKFRVGPSGYYTRTYNQTPSGEKRPNLVKTINKYIEGAAKRQAEQDEWLKTFCQNTEKSRIEHDKIIQKLKSQVKTLTAEVETKVAKLEECKMIIANDGTPLYTSFYYSPEELEYFSANSGFSDDENSESTELKTSKEALVHETMESLKKIKINRSLLKEIRQMDIYPKYMKDLVANKQLNKEYDEVRMNPRCSALLQNHLPPKENDPGSFILHCSIERLDFNNALADLGASVNIMPFPMFKRLGIGKLELIDMIIEMTDDTKCIPKGIVKNLLIKIDKFILLVDFVILDMIEDFRMPITLGRPLLATSHAKVDIFTKTISLEVGNEKVQESYEEIVYRCSLIAQEANGGFSPFEEKCDGGSLCHNEIKCYWESENDGKRIYVEWENLSLNDWLRIRFGEVSEIARDKILRDHWRKISGNEYDDIEDFKDPDGCGESKENEILGTIINKLHDEWLKGTHVDDDDLEGIIDYLEPTLYDGFIDSDDEEYKERKCRLLGMPYIKPPLILIEKVKVTRYYWVQRIYTKIKFSETKELSRTRGNIANIRAGIKEEILRNDDEKELYDEM
ncbi:RNA-directed DNA polymerase, eukaryota, reverse transcriptase zinc-binding domain protein [Tanacetum coccineum]